MAREEWRERKTVRFIVKFNKIYLYNKWHERCLFIRLFVRWLVGWLARLLASIKTHQVTMGASHSAKKLFKIIIIFLVFSRSLGECIAKAVQNTWRGERMKSTAHSHRIWVCLCWLYYSFRCVCFYFICCPRFLYCIRRFISCLHVWYSHGSTIAGCHLKRFIDTTDIDFSNQVNNTRTTVMWYEFSE